MIMDTQNDEVLKISLNDLTRSFEYRWADFKKKHHISFSNPKIEPVAKEYLWQGFLMGIQYIQELCCIDVDDMDCNKQNNQDKKQEL